MLDLNKIVNDEIQKAYLKGRKEAASELGDILSKKNNNNAYEIDMQMIDKVSEELNFGIRFIRGNRQNGRVY